VNILRLIRLCYWPKNLVVFLPAIVTKQYNWIFDDPEYSLWITFLSFTMVSVAGYIFNDLADFDSDRKDILKKKYKPLATGEVDKQVASFWLAVFLVGGLFIAHTYINNQVMLWEIAFFAIGIAYSFFLKSIPYVGLIIMSSAAAFRVLAGASTMEIPAASYLLIIVVSINLAINFAIQSRKNKKRQLAQVSK